MRFLTIVPYYLMWHYGRALKGITDISSNIVWFLWHFFSIGTLLMTLFSPWQRLTEEKRKSFDLGDLLARTTINVVMRMVGFLVRVVFILIGAAAIAGSACAAALFFLVWLVLPAAILASVGIGCILLVRPL